MKHLWVLAFLYVLCASGQEQTFNLTADGFYGVDDFNSVYYQRNNVLYKKNEAGVQQFYDMQLGEITSVDLINPLKVLLFYKETQTVVILDNRLNENQRINLSELQPYRYFERVGLAGERRLWLHDLDQNKIEMFNYISNEVVLTTPVIKMTIKDIYTDYNFCHVYGDSKVWSYNSYGSRTDVLEVGDEVSVMTFDFDRLLLKNEAGWKMYEFDKEYRFRESEISTNLPTQMTIKSLYLKAGKLYIWNGKQVAVFTINPEKK